MTDLYNPYGNMQSWYGVPDYRGNYTSYMVSQNQPLTMNRIMSMVRDIQQGQAPQLGNQAVSMSQPTLSQIPSQVAQSIFDPSNRLLSMPRMRWEQRGGMDIQQPYEQSGMQPGSGIPAYQPTGSGIPAYQPASDGSGGGSGSGRDSGGGGLNYSDARTGGSVGLPTYSSPSGGTPPSGKTTYPNTSSWKQQPLTTNPHTRSLWGGR